ncbi:MAG TPA: UDP-2,3-diacylglucosamine diphosphatase [Saprospiraceae bacterium]|nr:UDP-2,3-diacylglucosamine diphosphatase [Saprospiraceae bacterium]HRW75504.1 UDP-2,3-diacylglucosamine diphosphatase [Saprospiraceae bacterium]
MYKRKLCVAAISDVHLGTYGCHARELYRYLRSIEPEILVLNGDIIDMWEFRKRYFPADHLQVIKEIFKMASKGTKVYYITGNHDDVLRRFSNLRLGPIHLKDKLVLQINGEKTWIFHGDVFDMSINVTPLLARMGSRGYDWLIRINRVVNRLLERMQRPKVSLAGKIKHSVKRAVQFVQDFEDLAIRAAIEKGYHYVLCGHIHRPMVREVTTEQGSVTYLNSGDWVENLTAMEHDGRAWKLHHFDQTDYIMRNDRLMINDALNEEEELEHIDGMAMVRSILSGQFPTEELQIDRSA